MKKPDFVVNIISTFFLRERKKDAKLSQLSRNVQDPPRSLNPPFAWRDDGAAYNISRK